MPLFTPPELAQFADMADEAVGNTENRVGDAYWQGVRDFAAWLADGPRRPDTLLIGDATQDFLDMAENLS